MIGKVILHYKILEKLGEARLHFCFVGQGGSNYAIALLDRLALRPILRSFGEGGSPLFITEVHNDW